MNRITGMAFVCVAVLLGAGGCPASGPVGDGKPGDSSGEPSMDQAVDMAPCTDGQPSCGWRLLHAGTFEMGSPTDEPCREMGPAKENLHAVTLTRNLEIATTETTQAEFRSLMGYNPSLFASCGDDCPVENVSWYEAAAYCNALSKLAGRTPCYVCSGAGDLLTCDTAAAFAVQGKTIVDCPGYRLPTEAEWEFAYRAGTSTAFYNGTIQSCTGKDPNADRIAWYLQNSQSSTHPVRGKEPNAAGIHDMAGNVPEWCHDWYTAGLTYSPVDDPVGPSAPDTGTGRVKRGGTWGDVAAYARAARRAFGPPHTKNDANGFRCARSVAGP